jgi:hypothetical protein
MLGSTATAAVVAGVVRTAVMRGGVSSAQGSVRGTWSPVHAVSRVLPSRASGASGELVSGTGVARLPPDLTQGLPGQYLPQPGGHGRLVEGPQPWAAIPTPLQGQGVAGGLRRRHALVRPPLPGALTPPRGHPRPGARLAPPWPAPGAPGAACRRGPPAACASGGPPAQAWRRCVAGLWQ